MNIYEIQGSSHTSPLLGHEVTTSGIVTALARNGFYVQDPDGDGNIATSDGIFVFTGSDPAVQAGDKVNVSGTVSEFRPGGDSSSNLTITQIASSAIEVVSSGNDLPDAVIIGENGRTPPQSNIDDDGFSLFEPETDALDFYESLEGMVIGIEDAVAVGATSRFGEIPVIANGAENSENRTEAGGVFVEEDAFNADRLHLDDGLLETPSVNVGDQFDGTIKGVVDYSFGNYKVQLIEETPEVIANSIEPEVTQLTAGDDQLTIATYNVFNLDPSDGSSRGSDDQVTRLANQIVENLQSPDIIALQEIQDNNGTTNDGTVDASQTYDLLLSAISFEGGPDYEVVQIDPVNNADGGAPGSNIRVAYLYNPERVELAEGQTGGSVEAVEIGEDGSLSLNPGRVDPENPIFADQDGLGGARKSLVAEFTFNDEPIILVNNHLSSKFGSDPLFGRNQPAQDQTAEQRDAQAEVILDFVSNLLETNPEAKVVVLGDLNEFEFRNTHNILEEAGLTNMIDLIQEGDRYTFNFEGNSEILDGLLVSPSISSLTEIDIVHVNNDFTFAEIAGSDHEPIVARVDFGLDQIDLVGRYAAGGDEVLDGGAEITAYDAKSQRLFVTNGENNQIDIVSISDPATPELFDSIDLSIYGTGVNSVAAKNGTIAVAIENSDGTKNGSIAFFDADGVLTGVAEAGVLPDMVTFTPDGTKLLVANEAEPDGNVDPQSGITIVDLTSDTFVKPTTNLDFTAFDGKEEALREAGVRIFPDKSASEDLEPEYIAVSDDSSYAFVTLQENNALARVDLVNNEITEIVPLGTKDHSIEGNGLDASDRDGGINIQEQPLFGLYMPDSIDAISVDGEQYFVIANEGDARDEDARLSDVTLDPNRYPNAEELQQDENLGRIEVSTIDGDIDGDGDIDDIHVYGARSFSVLDAHGNIVYDSGDMLEQVVARYAPLYFNSNGDSDSFDGRSDNKGPEPEGLVTFSSSDGTPMVAVGLERAGGFMLFDLSNPVEPDFKGYFSSRDPDAEDGTLAAGDISPEGLTYISAAESPTSEPLLAVSYELSGTVALYKLEEAPEPFTLQLLAASDLEGGVNAITNAPLFAQLTEYFQDETGLPTLTVSAGDNVIPGPFFTSASEDEVSSALTEVYRELLDDPTLELDGEPGRVDISIMNILDFDASAVGNHEFDAGDGGFEDYVRPADGYPGPQFPYLSANLDFENSNVGDLYTSDILSTQEFFAGSESENPVKIAQATIADAGGEKIGIVGATTQLLEIISSPGSVTVNEPSGENNMVALAEMLQPVIDEITNQGINKVVLVTHLQQVALELELAGLLEGVDIIMAGGSDALFADETDVLRAGEEAEQPFPAIVEAADGNSTLVIGSPGEYSYLARLVVDFDAGGRIITDSIDAEVSGNYLASEEVVTAVTGDTEPGDRAELVESLTESISNVVVARDGNVFGTTDVFLEGRRGAVRTEETNLGNLTADANLEYAQSIDPDVVVSLKNGGGIRSEIGTFAQDGTPIAPEANPLAGKEEGGVSQLDIENALRFNNGLSIVEVTAQGLLEVLEHAVAATEDGATPGRFPQIGGLSFSFDPDAEAGDRIQSAAILNGDGSVADVVVENGEIAGDAARSIKLVTLSFLADGGDGYPYPEIQLSRSDLFLEDDAPRTGVADFAPDGTEQDTLAEYLETSFGEIAFNFAETSIEADERIQQLDQREDSVLDGISINTASAADITQSVVLVGDTIV